MAKVINKFNKRFSVEEKLALIRKVEAGGSIREECEKLGIAPESYRNESEWWDRAGSGLLPVRSCLRQQSDSLRQQSDSLRHQSDSLRQ